MLLIFFFFFFFQHWVTGGLMMKIRQIATRILIDGFIENQ